jgi:two-component system cell cycle sensor histidine kinase/response regulator CckA
MRTSPVGGHTPTVLLLDDDGNTLIALSAILERSQIRVVESETPQGAVEWYRTSSSGIDVVVADVVLRDSNGPEVVRQLKSMRPPKGILFISGFSLSELTRRGLLQEDELQPGYVEFLQKPFTSESFVSSVEKLLRS